MGLLYVNLFTYLNRARRYERRSDLEALLRLQPRMT